MTVTFTATRKTLTITAVRAVSYSPALIFSLARNSQYVSLF
jgi:hypothetical protein